MILKRLTVDKNILKISLYKAEQKIKQSIMDKCFKKVDSFSKSNSIYRYLKTLNELIKLVSFSKSLTIFIK